MEKSQIEPLEYWLVSVPYEQDKEESVRKASSQLELCVRQSAEYNVLDWHLPQKLRVGTLDSLISLSDELGKIDNFGKTVVQKLHRTYLELEETTTILDVSNKPSKPIRTYVTQFEWDDGYFDSRLSLKDLVNKIHANMLKTSENLRKLSTSLNEIQANLTGIERKKTGSLMTKSLQPYINQENWISGEYLTTALVIIPKNKKEEFESIYENFEGTDKAKLLVKQHEEKIKHMQEQTAPHASSDNSSSKNDGGNEEHKEADVQEEHKHEDVHPSDLDGAYSLINSHQVSTVVPDSLIILSHDEEFILYRVVVLKKGYDWFRNVCREFGYNVRTYSPEDDESKDDQIKLEQLKKDEGNTKNKLKLYCKNTFSETFANWFHLKIIRVFVESVLRFGLPVRFIIAVIKPNKGVDKKLLKQLDRQYSHLADKILQQQPTESDIDFSGLSSDFHPYVFIPTKIDLV